MQERAQGKQPGSPVRPSLEEIDAIVRRQLTVVGKAYWGMTLMMWAKFHIVGRLYSNTGYWWVAGEKKKGQGYQWDVIYEGDTDRFVIGHTAGRIVTEGSTEKELEAALQRAMEIGPIRQTPAAGYMG